MKRFLLALAVTGISANAWADIGNDQKCSQLTQGDINKACRGYDKSPSECYGLPTLVCPFDTNKVFCAHKNCEVGDIVYQDGRCYEDGSDGRLRPPNQSEDGKPLVAIGVVVDPATRLAVLPAAKWATKVWQIPAAESGMSVTYGGVKSAMHASACMNNSGGTFVNRGNSSYSSSFPAPTSSGSSIILNPVNSCGAPMDDIPETVQPMGYNWDISPLLQKILSPLNNFTPIKSAHAAGVVPSYGCAIPYVATKPTVCHSIPGQNVGGKFYTQKLMEFAEANSSTTFYGASGLASANIVGIKFPAAEYCSNITTIEGSGNQIAASGIEAFLPSMADLSKMFNNRRVIIEGLNKIDESEYDSVKDRMASGIWSSQQHYHEDGDAKIWDMAAKIVIRTIVGLETIVTLSAYRHEENVVACFINYEVGYNNNTGGTTVPGGVIGGGGDDAAVSGPNIP